MRLADHRKLHRICGKSDSYLSYGLTLPKRLLDDAGWHPGDLIEIWYDEERKIFVLRKGQSEKKGGEKA